MKQRRRRSRSGPTSGAASPTSTAWATPSAASSSCARARTRSTSSSASRSGSRSSRRRCPTGVEVVTTYDRSGAHRARHRHAAARARARRWSSSASSSSSSSGTSRPRSSRSSPSRSRCLLAFIPMYFMGLTSNIMSLAGIAISIGVLVDGAIVEVENAYKRLEEWIAGGRQGDFHAVRLQALKEVGPVGLLLAAGDRGRVPADLHAGRPGGPALQAARLLEEPGDGDRGGPRDHARPGDAHAVHAHGAVPLPARARWRRSSNAVAVGRYYPGGAPSDQPRPLRRLRAGLPLGAAPPRAHDRRRRAARRDHGPGLPPARLGVHAAAQRGRLPLHADRAARHVGHRGAAHPADPGPHPASVPRGRARLRQGRPRRHADRPGAVLDGRDHRRC